MSNMNEFDMVNDISIYDNEITSNTDRYTIMGSGTSEHIWAGDSHGGPYQSITLDDSNPKPRNVIDELRSSVAKWLEGAITV